MGMNNFNSANVPPSYRNGNTLVSPQGEITATPPQVSPQPSAFQPPVHQKNNTGKWAAGLAALTAVGLTTAAVIWKKGKGLDPTDAKALLKTVFEKDFSDQELEATQAVYKNLLGIKDKEAFIRAAFAQIKKDYGYEQVPMKLEIVSEATQHDALKAAGVYSGGKITIFKNRKHNQILNSLAHEFGHLRQHEYLHRAGLIEDVYYNKGWNSLPEFSKENSENVKSLRDFAKEQLDDYTTQFKPLTLTSINSTSPDYERAQKYSEAMRHYVNGSKDDYKNAYHEIEAEKIGLAMQRFVEGL